LNGTATKPPAEQRTCRACSKRFTSIRRRQAHEIDLHPGRFAREGPVTDVELLREIQDLAQVVIRGPSASAIAERFGLTDRAVRFRINKLHRLDLVTRDADNGIVLSPKGQEIMAAPASRRKIK
jgi:uncharacterized protein involved in type VI secretion and phage assembly